QLLYGHISPARGDLNDETAEVRTGIIDIFNILRSAQSADLDLHHGTLPPSATASRRERSASLRSLARISISPISTASVPFSYSALMSSGPRIPLSETNTVSLSTSL